MATGQQQYVARDWTARSGPLHGSQHPSVDEINRRTWAAPSTVKSYARMRGWTDPGERSAIERVARLMHGGPLLDIGVGAGRTTEIVKELFGNDYTGIDYVQEMVDACRERHPTARILHMDARDLGAFGDGQFATVLFPFNGIDSVGPEDRGRILREVRRVLQPGGLFVMSAHNRLGPGFGEEPGIRISFSWNPLKLAWRTARVAAAMPARIHNHRRLSAINESHPEWALMNCGAHDFGIVVMYTTLAEQKRQLSAAGFQTELVLDNVRGKPVEDGADTRDIWWFHYIARRRRD